MDQVNQADENELQKAIDNITNSNTGGTDAVAVAESQVAPIAPGADLPEVSAMAEAAPVVAETPVTEAVPVVNIGAENQDLAGVKVSALSDLKPILEHVDLPAEDKFKIYREIIGSGGDSDAIVLAYNVAKMIMDEKERAEALLFIVKTIDNLSTGD